MTASSLEEKARQFFRGVALAPMVRASTTPLRVLALTYGADFVYTEELVDRSLFTTVRVENETLGTIDYVKDTSGLSKKAKRRLERDGGIPVMLRIDRHMEAGKLVCQIGTGEPDLALQAARHVQQDVAAIDINMGCPKKFSVSGGMGAALLKDSDRACRIIKTLRDNLPEILVSCKIRLLDDDPSPTVDFCLALIHAGVHAIAIHARKAGQDSTVPALWDILEQVIMQGSSMKQR
jgi:tRNA-dihydrouridine synthase 2